MTPHPLSTAASAAAPELHAISEAKRLANAANAQLSTGPTSPEGKAKSSLNALKTALTGRTVLLPTEDSAAYQQHVSDYEKNSAPSASANAISSNLCGWMRPRFSACRSRYEDASWRLQRIPVLESAIYSQGRIQFAEQFNDQDPALRPIAVG